MTGVQTCALPIYLVLEPGLEDQIDGEIAAAVRSFEATAGADPLTMFAHAYAEPFPALEAQRTAMQARLEHVTSERPAGAPADAPAREPASTSGEHAVPTSPPMRGQRRPWRS